MNTVRKLGEAVWVSGPGRRVAPASAEPVVAALRRAYAVATRYVSHPTLFGQ